VSASIYWRPVVPKEGSRLNTYAPSGFLTALEEVFGSRTPVLERSDLPTLRGMAAVWTDGSGGNPYKDLINAIEKHEAVEVWAEY